MSSAHITINEKAFTALPPDMQKLVTDCAVEAVQNTRKTAQAETEDVVRKMAAEGAKVTPIDKAPIQQRAKEGVAKMEKDGAWAHGPVGPDPEAVAACCPRYKRLLDRIGAVERGLGIALILYMVARDHGAGVHALRARPADRLGRGVGHLRLHLDGRSSAPASA